MIIVVLLCAIVFYAILYLAWESTQGQLGGFSELLRAIDHMVWLPGNLVFVIFRGLIVVTMFYVIADWLVATAKRLKRYTTEKREKQRKPGLGWKKPPTP